MHEHLLELQIPVTSLVDNRFYFVAIVDGRSAEIAPAEAAMIRSYIEYTIGWMYRYGETFEGFVAHWSGGAAPFAAIGGHNTVTFLKRSDADWAYRRLTWEVGPYYVPQPATGHGEPLTLPQLLDGMNSYDNRWAGPGRINERWAAWKARYPDIFAVPANV